MLCTLMHGVDIGAGPVSEGKAKMTRNELDTKTVATLRKLVGTKNGRKLIATHRTAYQSAMSKMGFDMETTYHGFNDCLDMAELENEPA